MDNLIQLLMTRYGLSEDSAKAYAQYMTSRPKFGVSVVPTPEMQTAMDTDEAMEQTRRDKLAYDLIPGPKITPQAPGRNVPPEVRAFITGRDQVYRESQDPLTAEALRFWSYIDNPQEAWAKARGTRDMANKHGQGEFVREHMKAVSDLSDKKKNSGNSY